MEQHKPIDEMTETELLAEIERLDSLPAPRAAPIGKSPKRTSDVKQPSKKEQRLKQLLGK